MSSQKKSSKSKNVFKIIAGLIYLLIIIFYATFLVGNFQMNLYGEDAKFFGNYFYFINDAKSSAVIANPQTTVQVKDQIVFKSDDEYYTGTIDAVYTDDTVDVLNLQTNQTQKIEAVNIYGASMHSVPYLGSVMSFLLSCWGIIVLIVIPCCIFLIIQVVQLIRYSRRARNGLEEEEEEQPYFSASRKEYTPSSASQKYHSTSWQQSATYSSHANDPTAHASSFREDYELAEQKINREKAAAGLLLESDKSDYQKDCLSRTRLEEFLKQSDPALEDTLGDLHYKMKFQDTRELSKYQEAIIEENSEIPNLDKYGLQTSTIENGVEIKIDPKDSGSCILRLKNDGSLQIVTDAYVANIDAIV